MAVGMNTNAIFYPTFVQRGILKDAWDKGLTRIEISYYANSEEAEQEFLDENFAKMTKITIDKVIRVLNTFKPLIHQVHTYDLLDAFQNCCKLNQVFIQ